MSVLAAGIDVGASSVKVAIVRRGEGERVLSLVQDRLRRRDPRAVIESTHGTACERAGVNPKEVQYVASTGEGELVTFRDGHFYGMTTHARGGLHLCPEARSVLDIGALHARAITMDGCGRVLSYRMTSQCASGSGQFIENISRSLGVTLRDIGQLSLESTRPEAISSICAVLAETDVINMVSRGISTPDILRGVHESMAGRFIKLLRASKARGTILITGGLATDAGLLGALESGARESGMEVEFKTSPDSVHAGAIGAALWGAFRFEKLQARGGLARGQELASV